MIIPVKDNRFVIFDLGKREGKYWEEKEAKFDLACLSHPEAYIFFIEQQQYNCSKEFYPRCVYFSTVEVFVAGEGLLVITTSCFPSGRQK